MRQGTLTINNDYIDHPMPGEPRRKQCIQTLLSIMTMPQRLIGPQLSITEKAIMRRAGSIPNPRNNTRRRPTSIVKKPTQKASNRSETTRGPEKIRAFF
jgi:hypothetical protein